ncbi:tRNA pseudouridine(55) synthase [Neisseria meningitidis 2000063]|nr:tRNA pseudouridine(55) synthase [Neisseria meningitidis 2000063]
MTNKPAKRPVNGVLLLDKPEGLSSNTALQKTRHLFRAEKAGHTGVLDPLATGLLPVCFGEATKFAQYLINADKAYTATLKLGEASSTGDAEGEIVATARADISLAEFQTACKALTGDIRQVPPMFSALKHEGKPLYEYARKGIVTNAKRATLPFTPSILPNLTRPKPSSTYVAAKAPTSAPSAKTSPNTSARSPT